MATVITPSLTMQTTMPLLAGDSGITCFLDKLGGQFATGTFTFSGAGGNTETITLGTKVYTLKTAIVNTNDGEILLGASQTNTATNLILAIELGAGAGTLYSSATTINPAARAVSGGAGALIAIAKQAGTAGNSVATTDTVTNGTWGAATLINGADLVANQDNDWTLSLPIAPANGTNFTFISKDNGRSTINGVDYFTNWKITSPIAEGFIIRKGSRLLITTPTDNSSFTNESVIFGFSGTTQNSERRYEPGEVLTVTFRDGKWMGEIPAESNILGIGDI